MKKVLLVVIDALATRVVKPALARGDLPRLAEIVSAGGMNDACLSSFPSITPAATACIATGRYPHQHGIAGAFWYDRDRKKVAYHGDDFWVIVNQGLANFFHDFLIDLNYKRLRSDTIFELVERSGLQSCVINYMWFRGDVEHQVNVPLLLELLPGVRFAPRIKGPAVCDVADFIRSPHAQTLNGCGGLLRRFGFHDETTGDYLLQLSDAGPLPDFTLAYFPNNDFESHRVGAVSALPVLQRVDERLGEFIDSRGGLQQLLDEAAVIITGDHSQSDLEPEPADREIDLTEILDGFRLVAGGADWGDDDEIMACPNMRTAQIYFSPTLETNQREEAAARLREHARVDQVIRAVEDRSVPDRLRFHVVAGEQRALTFHRAEDPGPGLLRDVHGNNWQVEGDLSVVDAEHTGDGSIAYGKYPNAFERIATSFTRTTGDLLVTARLGSEFRISATETHPCGSHGSLHFLDSTAPLITAGVPEDVEIPEFPRIVDVVPLSLGILGLRDRAETLKREVMIRPD